MVMTTRCFSVIGHLGLAVVPTLGVLLVSGAGAARETDTAAIEAKDGCWYCSGTSGPPREDEGRAHITQTVLALQA